jgi:transcriptional regulator with XRE-family HTH domain
MMQSTAVRRECQRHAVTVYRFNPLMDTIGERVRARRTQIDMTRPELARRAGIAYSSLSDLELGLTKNSLALHKIAKILNCRVEWLETGRKPIEAPELAKTPSQPMRIDPRYDSLSTESLGFDGAGQRPAALLGDRPRTSRPGYQHRD